MTTYKLHSSPFHAALSTLLAHAARVRRRLARASWEAAARRTLSSLDDATLRDLGLDRTEIRSVVAEAFGDAAHSRLRLSRCPNEGP